MALGFVVLLFAVIAQPVVAGLAKLSVGPKLEAALGAVTEALRGTRPWDPPPPLTAEGQRRLDAALRWVPEAVATSLRHRVEALPLHAQATLRPLEVARQEGWSDDDAIEGFMLAVKGAALRLSWRVICPRCRGTSVERETLSGATIQAHCDTCGIDFDGSIADNIEAMFSVHPTIRPEDPPLDCVMSPQWTPHVLAQLGLAGSGDIPLELNLEVGCYRVEVPGVGSAWVEVESSAADRSATFVVSTDVSPNMVRIHPGRATLRFRSRRPHAVDVRVVKRWRPPFVLSAARLLSSHQARVLVPQALLVPELRVLAGSSWAMVVHGSRDDLDGLQTILPYTVDAHRARARLLVLSMVSGEEALKLCERLVKGGVPISVGLAHDVVVHFGDEGALGGPAVDAGMALLERVGRPRVVVGLGDLELLKAPIDERQGRVAVARREEVALLAFGSMLDAPETPTPAPRLESEPAELPDRIGPYRVIREIDRGGMGQVFEALDPDGGRAAVKIILPGVASSKPLQQRFFNEAWYAERIRHANVVEVREFGLHEERPWLAMEFLVGAPLSKELRRRRRLAPEVAAILLDGVLGGLGALHEAGLVHRDLKPANIMVLHSAGDTPSGVKLMDFGLVRRAGLHPDEGLMGTPDYMAPEQLVGDAIGPHTDVFAVGMMAYRMVVGRLPFRGGIHERFVERMETPVDDLPDLHLLGSLEPLVRAALAPADERPADAHALRELLP